MITEHEIDILQRVFNDGKNGWSEFHIQRLGDSKDTIVISAKEFEFDYLNILERSGLQIVKIDSDDDTYGTAILYLRKRN